MNTVNQAVAELGTILLWSNNPIIFWGQSGEFMFHFEVRVWSGDRRVVWLLLCLLFNSFIPKNCQEKNLTYLLFFEAFCLMLWNEKHINSLGQ